MKWHIGDLVWMPLKRRESTWKWSPAVVTATRKDETIVTSYGHEYTYPSSELRQRNKGRPTGYPGVSRMAEAQAWPEFHGV